MDEVEAESIGVNPVVHLKSEPSDEFSHGKRHLVVQKPFQVELRLPRCILSALILQSLQEVGINIV
jgi:hypothetical protein